jgi:hypothetical protein
MTGQTGIDQSMKVPLTQWGEVNLHQLFIQMESQLPPREPSRDLGLIIIEPDTVKHRRRKISNKKGMTI